MPTNDEHREAAQVTHCCPCGAQRTCLVLSSYEHEGHYEYYYEYNLSCGHMCERLWSNFLNYCPECGAKVVQDESRG